MSGLRRVRRARLRVVGVDPLGVALRRPLKRKRDAMGGNSNGGGGGSGSSGGSGDYDGDDAATRRAADWGVSLDAAGLEEIYKGVLRSASKSIAAAAEQSSSSSSSSLSNSSAAVIRRT